MEEQKEYKVVEATVENQGTQIGFQENLPNSGLVLTLGILSIVLTLCCCGPFALPLPIIGWIMGHKGVTIYKENPEAYTRSSYSNMNAGKICSIIGLILAILYIVYLFFSISAIGGWDAYMETIQEAMEQIQNQ